MGHDKNIEYKQGYYIPTKVDNKQKFNDILIRCVESIRRLDPTRSIVIIDDNSSYEYNTDDIPYNNIKIVKNLMFPGSGELYPYIHNYIHHDFDSYAVIHDSMVLKKPFTDQHWNSDCLYLWHFDTSFHSFINHSNLFDSVTKNNAHHTLLKNLYIRRSDGDCKDKWLGCFGVAMLVSSNFINEIIDKYDLLKIIKCVDTRGKRMVCERLIGILVYLQFNELNPPKNTCSINGSIFNHPCRFNTPGAKSHSNLDLDTLLASFKNYNSYVIKTWHGR